MKKTAGVLVLVAIVGAAGCGPTGGRDGTVSACPEGTTRRETMEGFGESPVPDTREAAIRTALENHGRTASDQAITAGVVASVTAPDGSEEVEIRTSDGVVIRMRLAPQNPGWQVERSTWCEPDEG